jgi:hypothetical protein
MEFPVPTEKFPVPRKKFPVPQKNSLFRKEQGISLQRIEIAKGIRVSRITGNLPTTH